MRKVLEMTFAGEDYRVVTAETTDAALAKLRSDHPSIVLCDVTLDGQGGYGLCAKIKAESPGVAVLIMASKQQPYDNQKGLTSRADDFIEKPFDTQQLVDKVKRLANRPAPVEAPPVTRAGPPGGPVTQPGVPLPAARPGSITTPLGGARAPLGATPPLNPRPTAPGMGSGTGSALPPSVGRGTLAYGGYTSSPNPPAGTPNAASSALPGARPPASHLPHSAPHAPAPAASAAPPVAAVAAVAANGQLAAKLQHLGLTEAQVSAVLALSREVVEKVVWEVVPVLAETMIKEEIKRLTSE
jgi:CheY-like chemotaxis protein